MLMVVFGAGASYDSIPSRPPKSYPTTSMPFRLPLGNELFDDRSDFVRDMSHFPRCQPIISLLQNLPPDGSVERVLATLQAEAEDYPERHSQLASIRFYLHLMLWNCELHWKKVARGITNYKTLLDQVERWRKPRDQICLVTFNYDTMLEDTLPMVGVTIQGLSDYIANKNYKLIKLHGSVNWAREVGTRIENVPQRDVLDVAHELIDRAADLTVTQRYRMVTERPIGKSDDLALFPAIAIPVESKSDYECPPDHLDIFRTCIPEVTKLLIIGWRATEITFLQLLAENFRQDVRTMVVAGSSKGAEEIIRRLDQARIGGQFHASVGGFTDFVKNREADEFLKI